MKITFLILILLICVTASSGQSLSFNVEIVTTYSQNEAREERRQEIAKERREFEARLTLERIDGTYIPANLGESFIELDKLLAEVAKKEMQALPKREDMIQYHHGLGTALRNSWGLWGGSRLQKYFTDNLHSHCNAEGVR